MSSWNLFDHYSFRARLQPALLTLLPAALAVFAWTKPGERWVSALWTLMGTAGFTYFLAILARNSGKALEKGLWNSWGGAPTTQMLRHAGPANPVMRERWHKSLSKLVAKPFPTGAEERASAAEADHLYEAGVKLLINKTRDQKKFPLVYKENVQYGYCRNLFAMKPTGLAVALIACALSCLSGYRHFHSENPLLAPWACSAICAAFILWWLFVVKAEWVRIPAFAYAERLLESIENLGRARSATSESSKKTETPQT